MRLILDNPYRIAGILANSPEKEIQKQKSKITKYASIGRQVDSEYDFSFFGNVERSMNSINKAFSEIEQNHNKVIHSLFWFLNTNKFDEIAFKHLIAGDKEKALEQWEKVTDEKEVTSKNYSCFNNIGTLKLLGDSKEEIKEGIEAKIKLIESSSFASFVNTVADQTYTIDNQKQVEKFVDDILIQFKGKYSSADTLKFFNNCNGTTQKYLSQKITEEPIHKIETQIDSTKNKRKTNKSSAYELGIQLFKNCKDDLALLKSLLGTSDLKYKIIADNLAKEVMQCGIDYFKEWEDTKDPTDEGLKLLKYAESIAVGSQTIERINSNIDGMEEFKEKDISQAIALLKSVKEAYETNAANIRQQARIQELTLSYGQSINWSKVNDLIENSIDWDKAVELILKVIPNQNINKIRNHQDVSKINEYKKLVEFIFNKLSNFRKSKVQYLQYWKPERTSSTTHSSESEGIPEWVKWVGGIILFIILIRACAG